MAMDQGLPGYQSLLSLIVMAVFGRGWFFHFTMWSVFLALCLSANTAFADFPRLTRAIALNDFLPHVFVLRGRRLLFSYGIYALTAMTAVLLIAFKGRVDQLISLYAIGAFLAFHTLPGRDGHPLEEAGKAHRAPLAYVFVTAPVPSPRASPPSSCGRQVHLRRMDNRTAVPTIIILMVVIKKHYRRVNGEVVEMAPLNLTNMQQPLVVIPMARWRTA